MPYSPGISVSLCTTNTMSVSHSFKNYVFIDRHGLVSVFRHYNKYHNKNYLLIYLCRYKVHFKEVLN